MAFGFTREPGTAAGYINVDNPVFAPGQRLSRRQYRKYLEQIGGRAPGGGVAAIHAAEQRLEALREALNARQSDLDVLARELAAREIALAERERSVAVRGVFHTERTRAGLRRHRVLVEMYQDKQRAAGVRLNKRQVAASPEFKQIARTIRETDRAQTTKARERDPNAADRALFRRKQAFDALGGADRFREDYVERYGKVKTTPPKRSGFGARHARARGR